MSAQKPSIPRGTRDFGPAVVARRNYIFGVIRRVFEKFGYAPLETPTLENLSVLTGKYGEEGDQLLFKVLNSGDFAKDLTPEDLTAENASRRILPKVAEKGLRYDLTVPFARYVAMNRGTLTFPFKRYQIQPVWRADRPQRGRYREFYQCDADVVGTDSLLCEAEIVLMMCEVLNTLGLIEYTIKINHRSLLRALFLSLPAQELSSQSTEASLLTAIDKLDKIGEEGVSAELMRSGFSQNAARHIFKLLRAKGTPQEILEQFQTLLRDTASDNGSIEASLKGYTDLLEVVKFLRFYGFNQQAHKLELDLTLARGLSYYTGCIFEIKINNVNMGSVSGGGRYDNLTGAFGLPDVSGVGFSFGVDRLYDCLEELNLFPAAVAVTTRCLLVNFDAEGERAVLPVLRELRAAGVSSELYPEASKLARQLKYADAKGIPFVLLQGSEERATGQFKLKNMATGQEQVLASVANVVAALQG